jgi:hypothetical protein
VPRVLTPEWPKFWLLARATARRCIAVQPRRHLFHAARRRDREERRGTEAPLLAGSRAAYSSWIGTFATIFLPSISVVTVASTAFGP